MRTKRVPAPHAPARRSPYEAAYARQADRLALALEVLAQRCPADTDVGKLVRAWQGSQAEEQARLKGEEII